MELHKNVFLALAAVAWADGKIEPDEADAIVRAALDSGMELDDVAEVEFAASTAIELSTVELPPMSKEDRVFVYALACWIADIDGNFSEAEAKVVAALGERLGVPEKLRARAEGLIKEAAALPEDRRPALFDLDKLRALIGERLVSVSKR